MKRDTKRSEIDKKEDGFKSTNHQKIDLNLTRMNTVFADFCIFGIGTDKFIVHNTFKCIFKPKTNGIIMLIKKFFMCTFFNSIEPSNRFPM